MTYLATMDSEHFSWLASDATAEGARAALAEGFLRHLEAIDDLRALERFGSEIGEDVSTANLVRSLHDWYGIRTHELVDGVCLRDGSPVPPRKPRPPRLQHFSARSRTEPTPEIAARLEELRAEIQAERISYGEIAELQGLAEYISPGDAELLEWAGVPEHDEGPVCAQCGKVIEEGFTLCDSCETQRRYDEAADDGETVHGIPADTATQLLRMAGLERDDTDRYGGKFWDRGEALRDALILLAGVGSGLPDVTSTVHDPASETFAPIMRAIQAGEFEMAARLLLALDPPQPEPLSLDTMGEEELRDLAKQLLPVAMDAGWRP